MPRAGRSSRAAPCPRPRVEPCRQAESSPAAAAARARAAAPALPRPAGPAMAATWGPEEPRPPVPAAAPNPRAAAVSRWEPLRGLLPHCCSCSPAWLGRFVAVVARAAPRSWPRRGGAVHRPRLQPCLFMLSWSPGRFVPRPRQLQPGGASCAGPPPPYRALKAFSCARLLTCAPATRHTFGPQIGLRP